MMENAVDKVEKDGERPPQPRSPPTPRQFQWLIVSLVAVYWAVFVYSLYINNCPSERDDCLLSGALGRLSFQPLEENTLFGPEGSTLVDLGGLKWNYVKKKQTKKWHIMSSIFFHTGLVDLILDTISLLFLGMELEQNFGVVKIGSLYLLSSLGGSLWASLKFLGVVYVGGPSGVCGLTGGAFSELLINSNQHEEKFKRFRSLCLGVIINFTIKLFPRADVSAHIGGLYMGFLLGFLLLIRCQPESSPYKHKSSGLHYSRYQQVLWVIALISTITQFLYSIIKFILR